MKTQALIVTAIVAGLGLQTLPASSDETERSPSTKIIGGSTTSIDQAPWQVALLQNSMPNDYDAQFCGGSILNASWVLTAAHCVEDLGAGDVDVLAGEATLSAGGTSLARVGVDEIIIHPGYDPDSSWRNDIALLRLLESIELDGASGARSISLPDSQVSSGNRARISGWGDVSRNPFVYAYPAELQIAQVEVFSDERCKNVYGSAAYSNSQMLCAGVSNFSIDTCQGDSGGPLAVRVSGTWVLHGITSFGKGCAQAPFPGVYTEVFAYKSWINSLIWAEPGIETMTPTTAPRGTSVTIEGENFSGITAVRIGSLAAAFTVTSDTELTFVVPSRAISGNVVLSNPGHNSSAGMLTVPASPKISKVSPSTIRVGTRITVTGSGFVEGATMATVRGSSGSLALVDLNITSPTRLTGVIPNGARSGNLVITTDFGMATKKLTIRGARG